MKENPRGKANGFPLKVNLSSLVNAMRAAESVVDFRSRGIFRIARLFRTVHILKGLFLRLKLLLVAANICHFMPFLYV